MAKSSKSVLCRSYSLVCQSLSATTHLMFAKLCRWVQPLKDGSRLGLLDASDVLLAELIETSKSTFSCTMTLTVQAGKLKPGMLDTIIFTACEIYVHRTLDKPKTVLPQAVGSITEALVPACKY